MLYRTMISRRYRINSVLILRNESRQSVGFFFRAEDGIRDGTVTGVQTCALPISHRLDGLGERRLVAHALQRDVGAVAARERAQLLGGIALVEVHRLGAELRGARQTIVHAVD